MRIQASKSSSVVAFVKVAYEGNNLFEKINSQ